MWRKNRNFADIPIVPGYMERLSPELQYDESTSAKALGKLTNTSPKKLDYVARSYTGVLGELGNTGSRAEGRGQNAGQRVGEALTKTFTADPLYSNDIMNDFYTLKEKYDTAGSDFRATKGSLFYNKARASRLNKAADNISEISKQIRNINHDKAISYEEKEERIRELKRKQQAIAERAIGK